MDKTDKVRKQTDIIEKAQRAAKNLDNVAESVNDNSFNQYFTEFEAPKTDNNTPANNAGTSNNNDGEKQPVKSDKASKLTIYFKVCSQVLAAQMTIYQKIFNEYFSFCKWYIKMAGGNDYNENKYSAKN